MIKTIVIDNIEYNLIPKVQQIEKELEKSPTFKAGDWVLCTRLYGKYVKRVVTDHMYNEKGYKCLKEMFGDCITEECTGYNKGVLALATSKEIQTHLIELAKEKGYNKAKKVKSVVTSGTFDFCFKLLEYDKSNDNLNDRRVSIYTNGVWGEIIKEEEKKFTFGGQEVKITKDNNNYFHIECKGETAVFNQLSNIINNPFIQNQFGNVYATSFNLHSDTIPTDCKIRTTHELLVNHITIGCLTGKYSELLDIYNHIIELNIKNK